MPWTMTFEFSLRKIDISGSCLARELGGLVGRAVHGVRQRYERMVRFVEDAPALVDVVAVEAYDEGLVGLVAQDLQRVHDAVGNLVARCDAAEHVDEHALDLLVVEDD